MNRIPVSGLFCLALIEYKSLTMGWDRAKGSFFAEYENRTVGQIARNLMEGAAVVTRAQQLRSSGVPIPAAAFDFRPRRFE